MQLIRICFLLDKMVNSLKLYPVKINKNMSCIQTKQFFYSKCIEREREREREREDSASTLILFTIQTVFLNSNNNSIVSMKPRRRYTKKQAV